MALCHDAGLVLVREWQCLPYDLYDVTGYHTTSESWLFSVRSPT
jgi:hypothetical protein